jgi:NADP-dependent 3-hydroxy acid dehydrogenase YdfG
MSKNIVITGASSGFGAMTARALADAGHMVLGPTEAFSVEQIADLYDVNVLSTQRANRAALPHLRAQRDGLLVWVRI